MTGRIDQFREITRAARDEALPTERAAVAAESGTDEQSERPINADVPRVGERPGDDDGFVGMGPDVDYRSEAREV